MSKILKKISASFLLILMLFSISFNVLDYGYKVYAANATDNGDGTVTITSTSGRFKLILLEEMVDKESGGKYLTVDQWKDMLSRYDDYYEDLNTLTEFDPIANNPSVDNITIDLTKDDLPASSLTDKPSAGTNRSKLLILVDNSYILSLIESTSNKEYGPLIHEVCHFFQNDQEWQFNEEISVLLEQSIITNGKKIIGSNGVTQDSNLEYFKYRSSSAHTQNYKLFNEIAYQILDNASVSAIEQAISKHNNSTSSNILESFEKFIRTLNDITGKDISALKLSNGQTIYQFLGGETESIYGYKYYYGQRDDSDSKVDYTEFKVNDEITIEGENEASLFIKIIGEDIREKILGIKNNEKGKDIKGTYKNGQKIYGIKFKKSGTYTAILDGKEIATIKVTINSNSEIKYVYVFNVHESGIGTVTDSNANKAKTDRENPENEIGTNSTEVNWIISDLKEKDSNGETVKYYCYNANDGLTFSYSETEEKYVLDENGNYTYDNYHRDQNGQLIPVKEKVEITKSSYYKYKSTENIKLDDNDLLILAFLQKVSEEEAKSINGGTLPPNWRANAIQYYIWNEITNPGDNIGYGSINTLIETLKNYTNGKNNYINFENKTITLDEKTTYKIKDYTAIKYIVEDRYDATNGQIVDPNMVDGYDKNGVQPLFTFDVELEEGPGIQLQKLDEDNNPLVAKFRIAKWNEEEQKWEYNSEKDEYTTDSKTGLTDIIPVKEGKYFIYEIEAPEGYKPTKQYVILEVDKEGKCTYKIYESKESNLDENGYVTGPSSTDTEVEDAEKLDWNSAETTDEEIILLLELTNKPDIPKLKIIKVDQDGVRIEGQKGEKFKITVTSNGNGEINLPNEQLDENGEINLSLVEKITGTKLYITVEEINPPEGYEPPEVTYIEFTVEYSEENGWEITEILEEDGFKVDIVNSVIRVTIKNIKKKDIDLQILKVNKQGESLENVNFTVSCDGLQGLNGPLISKSNGYTDILTAMKKDIKPGTYTVTITENGSPEGYKPIEDITFTITVDKDGSITVGRSSNPLVNISTKIEDDKVIISIKIVNEKEDEETPGLELPLIMTISGTVWLDQPQGKNSEANGKLDPGEGLKGIKVKLYEADGKTPAKIADKKLALEKIDPTNENGALAKKYLGSYYDEIYKKINMIDNNNNPETDENGKFVFTGLDPDKVYTLKFEYNGMRYSEIKASINIEGCGTPESIKTQITATAVEDEKEREKITNMFKEIGPYPNNYSGGLVFTQVEVEEYIKNGTIPNGATQGDMENFIENTKITAKIENLGGILKDCEDEIAKYNGDLDDKTGGKYVFPVVVPEYGTTYEYYSEDEKKEKEKELKKDVIDEFDKQHNKDNTDWVGYRVEAHEVFRKIEYTYSDAEHGTFSHGSYYGDKETDQTKVDNNYFKYNLKNYYDGRYERPPDTGSFCQEPEEDGDGTCNAPMGTHIRYVLKEGYFQVINYYVEEGYHTKVITDSDNKYNTRISIWDIENEPLYDKDTTIGKPGELDDILKAGWGWNNYLTHIDNNKLSDLKANEGLGKLYEKLTKLIDDKLPEPTEVALCLVYMPTVDLGIYDDVQRAIVTINNQTETYKYDQRAENGKKFQFGVNLYDINNAKKYNSSINPIDIKDIKEAENAYAAYYQGLTDGNLVKGYSEISSDKSNKYEPIGIRKEDIVINKDGTGSKSETGEAIAGYYNDYDVNIDMVYKITLYNEAAVSAHITSIWDYYMDTFSFVGVYEDAECKTPIGSYGNTNNNIPKVKGYNVMEINLSGINLDGNESKEIFIKLSMIDPKKTLGGDVLDKGYETWNYAEISGYGTKIGVIDIDSCPGDLIPEKRLEEGPYDDDEGKSPTLIFKNPANVSRTISGVMFEDSTGKTEIKSYKGDERTGDGKYTSGKDKQIAGATVQLIEVDEKGNPVDSETDPIDEPGLRAEALTNENGEYKFTKIVPSNYIVRFAYGNDKPSVLTKLSGFKNDTSYNGESYESTIKDTLLSGKGEYWYTEASSGTSYIEDNISRRNEVTNNFKELTNEKAEILNSWKDSQYIEKLVNELIKRAHMYADTERMLLDVEYHPTYPKKIVETKENGNYTKTYEIGNINGGIVERERAELQITKKVSEISIVDSTGKEITGGKWVDDNNDGVIDTQIDYIKWLQGEFVDMEIDSELLSGATLKITYEMSVTNTSEKSSDNSNPNTIKNIKVIDYVSNNLNYDASYGENLTNKWKTETVQELMNSELLNNTSLTSEDASNRIDLLTYQTILTTTFDSLNPGETKTRTLTLEKNLSSEEDSDFNYENQVEIVYSENPTGRGDYSSIYGNLDPTTYTSRQGNLNWDKISTEKPNPNEFPQQPTDETVISELGPYIITKPNAIRLAEKDSGNAEEVIITPPTGVKGIVFETYHYVLALIGLLSLAGTVILIKKYIKMETK